MLRRKSSPKPVWGCQLISQSVSYGVFGWFYMSEGEDFSWLVTLYTLNGIKTSKILVLTELGTVISIFIDCFSFCICQVHVHWFGTEECKGVLGQFAWPWSKPALCYASCCERSCLASDCVFVPSRVTLYAECQ